MNATANTATVIDTSANGYSVTLYNEPLWRAGVTTNYVDKRPRRRIARKRGGALDGAEGSGDGAVSGRAGHGKLRTVVWEQTYAYDQWGNMLPSGNEAPALNKNDAKNQITQVDGMPVTYDNAGNLVQQTVGGSGGTLHDYSYDANNRMWKAVVDPPSTAAVATHYVYDGLGRRVKKITVGGTETRFIYNATGELVAEYEGTTRTKEYAYGPSGLLAVVQNPGGSEAVEYATADHLGTPRVITDASGMVKTRHDYFPFGAEITGYGRTSQNGYPTDNPHNINQEFTAKERDTETGLDYFGARYFASGQGRFTGVDPISITVDRLVDPQRLNLYAYVRNNPLTFINPSGRDLLVAIWTTHDGRVGHAAIAVSNYKEVKETVRENGKTVTRSRMVPDGTYTYRDLWPGPPVGSHNFDRDVKGVYHNRSATKDQFVNSDVTNLEGRAPEGVVEIKTDYETDIKVMGALDAFQKKNPSYNGVTSNCSDFTKTGVEAAVGEINAEEEVGGSHSQGTGYVITTPNRLYKAVEALPNATVLRNPGATANNTFADGYTKKKHGEEQE